MSKIRIAGFVNDSIVDGPGLRFCVFTQGCRHNCKQCHNAHTHALDGGYEIELDEIIAKISQNPLLSGVTLSGGEPFIQADKVAEIAQAAKAMRLEVAIYSGFTFEELLASNDANVSKLLSFCDVLIDGRFDLSQKSLDLKYRGSENQRIINVCESLRHKCAVLEESPRWR